jgi:predicted  nucleic acid-binding Zn-ribbon protein
MNRSPVAVDRKDDRVCQRSHCRARQGRAGSCQGERRGAGLRHHRNFGDHARVSTPDPHDGTSSGRTGEAETTADLPTRRELAEPSGDQAPKKRRNPWIWICAVLALAAAGLLIWALTIQSDLDSTQQELATANQELDSTSEELDGAKQELASTQQELDSAKQDVEELRSQGDEGNSRRGALVAANALYDEFAEQLDATNDDLAATQKDLEEAQKAASDAEEEAAAAMQDADAAGNEADKANAEADQAQAEVKAAEAKATVAADCAKAYISAFGALFEGENVRDQAPEVREQLSDITASCKEELTGD